MLDILFFVAVLAAAGAIGGVIAGLLGVGGGIVIVPVLFYLLPLAGVADELRMHIAVATSLATIIATSIVSARAHYKRGGVDVPLLKSVGGGVVVGTVIGVVVGTIASAAILTAVFAGMALIVSIHMTFFQGRQVFGGLPGLAGRTAIGVVIGAISTMMGIGGGSLAVPTFTLCGVPIRRAVGTAAAIGLIIAVPATIGFAVGGWDAPNLPVGSLGYVNAIGFVLIAPLSTLCAPLGARLAHTIPQEWLSRLFALFLAITAVRMFMSL